MVDVLNLHALPPRPPTPPRASSLQPASFKDDPNVLSILRPGQLPSPPNTSPHPHSDARSKKVNFSPLTSYIKPLDLSNPSAKPRSPLRNLRPSNECKPAKSILKSKPASSSAGISDEPSSSPLEEELPTMLESITQQLSGDSRVSRSDAYMQLLGSLAAYRDTPDTSLLCHKVGMFTQFIRRDVSQELDTSNPSDISLVRQALRLLSMFVWKPGLSTHLPDDFKVFFIDHAISSLQNQSLPKSIIVDYMRILSLLNFTPKILASSKALQILAALKDITARVGGKAVVALRLAIYEKLLYQSKATFASQASTWVDNIITALLHKMKDIRVRAIKFGFQAAAMIGPNTAVSKAVQDALDVPEENGSPFVEELSDRLIGMLPSTDSGLHVPQVWSIVILLLRQNRWSIDQWDHLKKWLFIIQKCFNHSDSGTRLQALVAWDRFVYAIHPNESTTNEMTKLLCRPILSQLERKRIDKPSALSSQAFSSYYHLLYYAFRPSLSHQRVDVVWKEYLVRPVSQALVTTAGSHETSCRILAAMFWNPHPKLWDERRPIESSKLAPTDLPRLDFRWARSRLSAILPVFETLFRTASWPERAITDAPIGIAWTHLSKCLSDASSKEIQPSSESMQAIGHILEMLQRVWKSGPRSLNVNEDQDKDLFLSRFHFLSTTIISTIGPIPFTDKLLLKTSDETFQSSLTPTHRHAHGDAKPRAPIIHLLQLTRYSPNFQPTPAYCHLVRGIIEVALGGRTTRSLRLDTLCQFAEALDEDTVQPLDASAHFIWKVVSDVTKQSLDTNAPPHTTIRDSAVAALRDYDKVKKILLIGTKIPDLVPEWSNLLHSLAATIQTDQVNDALVPIVEDVADRISSETSVVSIPRIVALLDQATFPENNERSRKPSLPINKIPNSKPRQDNAIPCEKMMALATKVLIETYEQLSSTSASDLLCLFEGMVHFVDRWPITSRLILLEKCQAGLSPWFADGEGKITKSSIVDKGVLAAVQSLLTRVVHMLEKCEDTDTVLLDRLATLVTSGLESRHKSTANSFIRMWNATFGLQQNLSYPAALEKALRRLQPFTDLQLPGFPGNGGSEADVAPTEFLNSQEDSLGSETPRSVTKRTGTRKQKKAAASSLPSTPAGTHEAHTPRNRMPKRQAISTPKARLRHDDSQIQFIAVDSSPACPPETQNLTEHQRDVRERQRTETSRLFSDLQSSSSLRHHSRSPRAASLISQSQANAPGTPPLPVTVGANDDDVPFSSPTPGSKDQNAHLAQLAVESSLPSIIEWTSSSDADPPSSPPQPRERSHSRTPKVKSSAETKISPGKEAGNAEFGRKASPKHSPENELQWGTPPSASKRKHGAGTGDEDQRTVSPRNKKQKKTRSSTRKSNTAAPVDGVPNTTEKDNRVTQVPELSDSKDDRERVEIVPDSFSDELEQQIASQLEQDLELSMDLELNREDEVPARSTRLQKRKREETNAPAASRREKKVTTGSKPSPADRTRVPVDEGSANSIQETGTSINSNKPGTAEARPRRKTRSSPESTQQQQNLNRRSTVATVSHPPVLMRRRSSRLKGEPAAEEGDDEPSAELQEPQDDRGDSSAAVTADPCGHKDPSPEQQPAGSGSIRQQAEMPEDPEVEPTAEASSASPDSILSSLRDILGSVKSASFGASTLREMDDLMFDIKMEAHNAVRRHDS